MPKKTFQLTHQRLLFVLFPLVLSLFPACSSAPSESQGRKFFEDKGAAENVYRVKSFTKTNGISTERSYTMEYKAELECLQGDVMAYNPNVICWHKGDILKKEDKLVFEKTENGWRIVPPGP